MVAASYNEVEHKNICVQGKTNNNSECWTCFEGKAILILSLYDKLIYAI